MSAWRMYSLLVTALFLVFGCAATQVALEHKDLKVQTQMSETIFLDPAPPEKKTLWIEVKNTSDKPLELPGLAATIGAKGYKIIADPTKANYRLQVNILSVGQCDPSALRDSIYAGWGGALAGAAAGSAVGLATRSSTGVAAGGLIGGVLGGAAELVAGSLVKNVTYAIITDVQISEYSEREVAEQQSAQLKQGTQTTLAQEITQTSHWKRYRTRIGSSANKVNLSFEEAQPAIVDGLQRSLAGCF
jgi:hypothetical protein